MVLVGLVEFVTVWVMIALDRVVMMGNWRSFTMISHSSFFLHFLVV